MNGQLLIGTAMSVATVIFHVVGLVMLVKLLRQLGRTSQRGGPQLKIVLTLTTAMLCIIFIHTVEAWVWAGFFFWLGEFTSIREALYFSVVTSTTLGYGDVTLTERWRLLGTFEAMGGLILFGASTAFLVGLVRRLLDTLSDSERSGSTLN